MKTESSSNLDNAFVDLPGELSLVPHSYGERVHIINDLMAHTLLARLCEEKTTQPEISRLVTTLYHGLMSRVLHAFFPRSIQEIPTRMQSISPNGTLRGVYLAPETKAVCVNVLRAGTLPSLACYDLLNGLLKPQNIRQDYVVMARETNHQEEVTGAYLGDSKIGGPIENAMVLFPDPMGATGSSTSKAITHYKEKVSGTAKKLIAMNLIITPEYIKKMQSSHPDVEIVALRLDRGASSEEVLSKGLGEMWAQESGLTEKHYIIPGGGGFGEIINNSYC